MRKLITWIVVSVGIAALVRKLRSRGQADTAETQPVAGDPADELRQTLASSRESEPAPQEFVVTDPPIPAPASEPTIDERRADVHDEGRQAIDEMRKTAD